MPTQIDKIRDILEEKERWWPLSIAAVLTHGYQCEYCEVDVSTFDMHDWPLEHLRPKSVLHQGPGAWTCECRCGCNAVDNLVIACRVCNGLKGNFDPATGANDDSRAALLEVAKKYVRTKRADRDRKSAIRGVMIRELYSLGHSIRELYALGAPIYGCVGADTPAALRYIREVDGLLYYTCPSCRAELR